MVTDIQLFIVKFSLKHRQNPYQYQWRGVHWIDLGRNGPNWSLQAGRHSGFDYYQWAITVSIRIPLLMRLLCPLYKNMLNCCEAWCQQFYFPCWVMWCLNHLGWACGMIWCLLPLQPSGHQLHLVAEVHKWCQTTILAQVIWQGSLQLDSTTKLTTLLGSKVPPFKSSIAIWNQVSFMWSPYRLSFKAFD